MLLFKKVFFYKERKEKRFFIFKFMKSYSQLNEIKKACCWITLSKNWKPVARQIELKELIRDLADQKAQKLQKSNFFWIFLTYYL